MIATYIYKPILVTIYPPSVLGIQKGITLRLRRICSTDEEYSNRSKEYRAYLISRGHNLKNVEKSFNDVLNMPRQESRNLENE